MRYEISLNKPRRRIILAVEGAHAPEHFAGSPATAARTVLI
jgi:hypothetical protein